MTTHMSGFPNGIITVLNTLFTELIGRYRLLCQDLDFHRI
jgi:hypothetical protein